MKIRLLLLMPVLSLLTACAGSQGVTESVQKEQARVLPITGGFAFKEYVTVALGDKEVLGDEGVFYIAPQPFGDADYAALKQNAYAKGAELGDLTAADYIDSRVADVCLAAVPRAAGRAGNFGRAYPLKISAAFVHGDTESFRVQSEYGIELSLKDGAVVPVGKSPASLYSVSASRLEITADPAVTFQSCLTYAKDHAAAGGG